MRHEGNPVLVFDPRGIVDVTVTPLAARKTGLDGLRLGILDNSKWNANKRSRPLATAGRAAHAASEIRLRWKVAVFLRLQ
jgi:hypothetical protein